MDSLLCDEVWLMTDNSKSESYDTSGFFYTTKEDCQQAYEINMGKEIGYMPESGYQDHLQSSGLSLARFRVIHWFIKSQSRLKLSCQTVFNAANYFDRFLSKNQCKGWKYWMVELLAIACLSIASKFVETAHPPFHEIQMEDVDHSFQSSLIQRMELTLVKALGWQLGSITPYSYVELFMSMSCDIHSLNSFMLGELNRRATQLLLRTLSESEFLEFRPCVVTISALRCVIKELLPSTQNSHLPYITIPIPEEQKDDLIKCHKIMEGKLGYPSHSLIDRRSYCCCPPSPVTVLKTKDAEACDLLFFSLSSFNTNLKSRDMNKRKREEG